jgi:hypothetical protein
MSQKQRIKEVLDEFFGITNEINESSVSRFKCVTVDEVDTEILSNAINEALNRRSIETEIGD